MSHDNWWDYNNVRVCILALLIAVSTLLIAKAMWQANAPIVGGPTASIPAAGVPVSGATPGAPP